ncbi:MMPL family transporter [Paenibacillus antri]|uniref:MMPL family transporter n=1 Tax=Paenibacillus antri TaxID=2582848 RepID=A0A5R9G7V4_9BACL|nr:MMPL family transporter [Paenibacillus antri]TLS49508.1 MMPL family transporter [Paenibacillus antri]
MKTILKWRWAVFAGWIVVAVALFLTAPNMEELVRTKGQITVPEGASSDVAAKLMDELNAGKADAGSGASAVLVFHNASGLTDADRAAMKDALERLKADGAETGVTGVTTHFDTPELESQLVAEDGKTVLSLVTVDFGERTPAEARDALYSAIDDVPVDHYYTGGWLISEDVIESSQEGLKKTEWITVVFILAILLLVFRSAIAPFIPLIAVGFSYIVAQSVVAYLVEYANFPLSNFTQIFLVAVLFGIGTDYCILLISRFKEELAHSGDASAAVVATYRASGKTVFFSGLAVLVGFVSIGFSTFALYRSAVAVAVGVAVLLLALVTLVPFFLATFGKAIFWPARGSLEHKQSGLWGAVGRFSLKRPAWALLLIAVVTIPFLSVYQEATSYSSLDEIGDKYDSVKAFDLIAESFGPGDSLPTTVVVKADRPFDSQEGLSVVEQVSRELAKVDGVKTVRSATRPTGEPLEDLQVTRQVGTLEDGLGDAGDGLGEIGGGLSEASAALGENAPKLQEAVDGAGQLIAGTNELKNGIAQLGDGLKRIEQGLRDGSAGAGELKNGLTQAQRSAEQLSAASAELLKGYQEIGTGLAALSAAYDEVATQQASLAEGLTSVGQGLGGLALKYPELQSDETFLQVQGAVSQLQGGAAELAAGLKQLNAQLAGVTGGMQQANAGFQQAAGGQAALADGLAALAQGIGELQAGIAQAAEGQARIVGNLPDIEGGFDQLADGQRELQSGFAQLTGQLGELTDGLDRSVDGLSQVTDGLQSAQEYLTQLSGSPNPELTGWYLPQEAVESDEFKTVLDTYLSVDRQIVKFDVVFDGNPYDTETMDRMAALEAAVERGLRGTEYASAAYALDGVTSMNNDLREVSANDYARTVVLMLVGILLILVLLFRSIVMPIYLVLSLLLTYFTSMAIAEVLFVRILGLGGISWAVPFFAFVLLMALGIDYSIFLMDRFKEYRHLKPTEGILLAMKNMGTVIMSAAVILGGTFAAMLPSGVMSLMQIAVIVLCGLFLYALVMLPLFIPVMVRTFGEANWWPFMNKSAAEDVDDGEPSPAYAQASDSSLRM